MFECVLRAAVLEVTAGEILMVVANRQPAIGGQLRIGLDEEHVLVLSAGPALCKSGQGRETSGSACVQARARRNRDKDVVGLGVTLPVVVGEQEMPEFLDRAAVAAAELVVVV